MGDEQAESGNAGHSGEFGRSSSWAAKAGQLLRWLLATGRTLAS